MATPAPSVTPDSVRAAIAAGDLKRAADALASALRADPDCAWAYRETIDLLARSGRVDEAEQFARRALARLPDDPTLHARFGTLLSERNELVAGGWHLRRALELGDERCATLVTLALNLMRQGRPEEAESLYAQADRLAPGDVRTLAYWSKACEVQHDLPRAEALLARAAQAGAASDVDLLRAQYLAREGRVGEALAQLEQAPALNGDALLERGRLKDRAGRHGEAWQDFVAGKQKLAEEAGGLRYEAAAVEQFFARLEFYFTRATYTRLPRASRRADVPQPLFVCGFPRSGTTLLEHVLAAHPAVRAGGELPFAGELRELAHQLLPSREPFPFNLDGATTADRHHLAALFRDHYFARAECRELLAPGAEYFVDKMPFNEVWLPLIRIAFPHAPIVHLVRHPLDVCVSMMSHQLNHGFRCGYRLEDTAHYLAAVHRLHGHYRHELEPSEFILRYESLVANPRGSVERLLGYLGLPFDETCLRFHERRRYAPTPSYAQVAEPFTDRSIGRHRPYAAQLEPVRPVLAPLVADWQALG
ncbi:MAG TPA: sulfotransferase [Steroidobacteraceae bacterium]|nr:sulfotransferase [Steroidobacteraceae bacterium]